MSAIAPLQPFLFPFAFTVDGLRSLDGRLNKPGFIFSKTVLLEYKTSKRFLGTEDALHELYNKDAGADKLRIIQSVFSKHCSSPVYATVGGGVRDRTCVLPGMGHGKPLHTSHAMPRFFGAAAAPRGTAPLGGAGARPPIAPGSRRR